ncbi:tripartite tricarboxylate transporter substrate binding protein [Oceanimonas smirnovii]|uniref:Tripartite tricarboxylate transporter substrate binding protein n=1 Tax=Oceanimonas smirnovii TaxID=264574 RepID=A0ABW7NYJ1_9GAMM
MNIKDNVKKLGIVSLLALPMSAYASYPEKGVNIVIPYGPGGSADIQARLFAEYFQEEWGKNVRVVSRQGGAGAVGMNFIKNASPDGYNITFTAVGPVVVTPNRTNAGYNSVNDFEAVALTTTVPYTLNVNSSSDIQSIADVVETSQQGNGMTYGTTGAGLHLHLITQNFFDKAGINARHISSQGAGETKSALLGNHIDLAALSMPDSAPLVKADNFRALAVFSGERTKTLPDVPTLKELGYDTVVEGWFGFMAPKDTPEEVVTELNRVINKALQDGDFVASLNKLGLDVAYQDSATFSQKVANEYQEIDSIINAK